MAVTVEGVVGGEEDMCAIGNTERVEYLSTGYLIFSTKKLKGFDFVCEAYFVDIRKTFTGVRILVNAIVHDTDVLAGIVLSYF